MLNKKKSSSPMEDNYVNIICSIVAQAAGQTDGVASITDEAGSVLNNVGGIKKNNKSIKVDIINDSVTIELSINAYDTMSIPTLICALQENIKKEVEKATSYRVKSINVNVVGVVFTS